MANNLQKGSAGPMRLYVGSLHFNITEDMLRGIFEPFGRVNFTHFFPSFQIVNSLPQVGILYVKHCCNLKSWVINVYSQFFKAISQGVSLSNLCLYF